MIHKIYAISIRETIHSKLMKPENLRLTSDEGDRVFHVKIFINQLFSVDTFWNRVDRCGPLRCFQTILRSKVPISSYKPLGLSSRLCAWEAPQITMKQR